MKFAMILYVAIYGLSIHQLLSGQLAELSTIFGSFLLVQPLPLAVLQHGRWADHREMGGKATSTLKTAKWYLLVHFHLHISHKAAKSMANSSASCVMNYSQLSPCQGVMEPSEGYPNTCGYLRRLRNKTHPVKTVLQEISQSCKYFFLQDLQALTLYFAHILQVLQ